MHRTLAPLALAFLCLTGLGAPRALATWYGTESTYAVTYHFTAEAWGKPVASVAVHTGVLVEHRDGREWQSVQHLAMQRDGDHYTARATLVGSAGGGSGAEYTLDLGPVAQYWVEFADGTTSITEVSGVPVVVTPPAQPGTFATLTAVRRTGG